MFLFGLIVGILLSWGLREAFGGYAQRPVGLKILGNKTYAIVCAIGEALLPQGGDIPLSHIEARVPQFVDEYMANLPAMMRNLIFALFFLMEHAAYLFAFTTHRLSDLPVEKRVAYLDGWENSRIYYRRMAFMSLRAIYGMAYLGCPDVEKAIGYFIPQACRDALIIER